MIGYLVLLCDRCRRPTMAYADQRTKVCPFCGWRFKISRINVIAETNSSIEARNIVSKHKEYLGRRGEKRT